MAIEHDVRTARERPLSNQLQRYARLMTFGAGYAALAASKTLAFGLAAIAFAHLGAGIASDQFEPTAATLGTASVCIAFGVLWAIATWSLWRPEPRT